MKAPKNFGLEDITCEEQEQWEKQYGEYWADHVAPETRTHIWDFDTREELEKFFVESDLLSHYYARTFERVNIHWEYGWEWEEKDLDLTHLLAKV